jgi:hypothetical protein
MVGAPINPAVETRLRKSIPYASHEELEWKCVPMANKLLLSWFDQLESVLEKEAQLVGLLDHSSTVGQAREFLVARLLKTILPSGVHIGSGIVIDGYGNSSKQIDIVIYDPKFPLLTVESGGLYFIEGVLATIEIKSTLDTEKLKTSLENSKSILTLGIMGEHPEEAAARIRFYEQKCAITHAEAEQRFWYMFRPPTYIFSFNSSLSHQTTVSGIKTWWEAIGCKHSAFFPLLPRVIVTGNAVGIVNDGWITLRSSSDGPANPTAPQTQNCNVMSVFPTNLRFRWLALHLMNSVGARLGLRNHAEKFDYRISDYFPLDEYVQPLRDVPASFIRLP